MKMYTRRILLSLVLGVIFALVDVFVVSWATGTAIWSANNPVCWAIFLSRFPIGFFVGLVGTVTEHPVFPVVHMRYLRGIGVGLLLSLGLGAISFSVFGTAWSVFFVILIAGAVYGLVIDWAATTFVGDGKQMIAYED